MKYVDTKVIVGLYSFRNLVTILSTIPEHSQATTHSVICSYYLSQWLSNKLHVFHVAVYLLLLSGNFFLFPAYPRDKTAVL